MVLLMDLVFSVVKIDSAFVKSMCPFKIIALPLSSLSACYRILTHWQVADHFIILVTR